jgi:CRISPR-associated protein Cas1
VTSNLKTLARFGDSLAFLYLEHAVVEQEDASVVAFTADGRISLPAASMSTLLLGPGVRITHAAVSTLGRSGCLVAWVGEDGLRFYAAGQPKTRSSANLERQCRVWADSVAREGVVRRLYELRFGEALPAAMTLQQIRGREGARVRDAYAAAAKKWNVSWAGRQYDRAQWSAGDPVNRALSAANAALYAVCSAGLHALGYSPALGFIHTGKQLSFVYDLADLYKLDTTVPAAFEAAAQGAQKVEMRAREYFRRLAWEQHLPDKITKSLSSLFGPAIEEALPDGDPAAPGALYDAGGPVSGGIQHAGDDS